MTLGQHQEAFAADIVRLLNKALELGYGVRLGEFQRMIEQQRYYMQVGRSTTMNSMHLKKCAADIHFTKDGKLVYPEELGVFWESLDHLNSWGGHWKSFKDKPHFQRKC